tara:strand:- start:567 stop:758 length:192 start_codon:yes stop_codon:yes gene_type:complete
MNCWHCNTKLIWGGDHDIDAEDDNYSMYSAAFFSVVTNLSCPNCDSIVDVYYPREEMTSAEQK